MALRECVRARARVRGVAHPPPPLQTCPVLLILLTNMPRGKYKKPEDTLVALVGDQVMIVFGIAAVFYTGAAKAILYIIGCLAGGLVFKIAVFTFLNASASFPAQARGPLWFAAGCFFIGWLMFAILWLVGPEGYGNLDFGVSQMCHALADLISKNTFGFLTWYIRFKIIKPWEAEQQRLKREAEEKAAEYDIDPAFQRAYDGGYAPPALMDAYGPVVIRRTPATVSACNSLLDAARRFTEDRKLHVLLIEEEGLSQKSMLDAFENVEECEVHADVLFSLEDVPRLYERGVPKYAAVFVNIELLKHLAGLPEATLKEMELDVYTPEDFREEHRDMRKMRRKNFRKLRKMREDDEGPRRREEEEEEEEDFFLYDSEEDARAAVDEEGALHACQRLFGARTVIAYRMGRGSKKASKEDRSRLGYNVFLKHPTDAAMLSRVFYRLAPRMGVEPMDMARERLLEQVLGTVEATVMGAQNGNHDGYDDHQHYRELAPMSMPQVMVPRQSSSLNTLGQAFLPEAYEMPPMAMSRPRPKTPKPDVTSPAPAMTSPGRTGTFAQPPPPVGRMGSGIMPKGPEGRQASYRREFSSPMANYEEEGSTVDGDGVRVDMRAVGNAARFASRSRRR
jgi:hypothetical protein